MDFYEPRWRSALNVQGGEEMPTLPLSVNGSIAMVRGEEDGTSSPDQWFIYQFDKRSAGLGGMAFEEVRSLHWSPYDPVRVVNAVS